MSRETGKAKNKGQKRLVVKKVSIKDLQPRKEIKAGIDPVNGNRLRTK